MKEIEIHFKGGDGKRIKTLPQVPDNSDYVDLLTNQDIDGKKNFIQTPTINGKDITTQEKLDELSNSKQNTLTAGAGISIENDTISITDVGGLTVLPYGDLDADTLAKVKANPQKYCIYNSVSTDKKLCYFLYDYGLYLYYTLIPFDVSNLSGSAHIKNKAVAINKNTGGVNIYSYGKGIILQSDTFKTSFGVSDPNVWVIGVQDTTDNTIKTGTEIRKAITIRKWH